MIRGYFPFVLAATLIAVITFVEGFWMKDRWGAAGVEASKLGERFAQVPKEIGPWVGEDLPVDEIVKKTAGAVEYVSRRYKNSVTGQEVRLWLIIGHSRDVVRHTPNVCYPASGFRQQGEKIRQAFTAVDGNPAEFFTARFEKEDAFTHHIERVFWAWNHPDHNAWGAPDDPRFHYGMMARALYKAYFTANVVGDETVQNNAAAEFIEVMLPAIDKALFPKEAELPEAENETEAKTDEPAETAATASSE